MSIKHGTRTVLNRAISMALSVVMTMCIAHTTTIVHGISTNAGISGTVFETSGSGPEYSRWGSPGNLRTMGARFTILRFRGGVENVNSTEDGDVDIVGTLDVYEDGNMPYNNNALGSAQSPNFKYFGTNAITIRRMYEHIRAEVDSDIAGSGADAMDRTVRSMLDAMSIDGGASNNGMYGTFAKELFTYKKNNWNDYQSVHLLRKTQ